MGESGVYAGLRILELGAGAAGPVATRYFAEQGATVIRVESSVRPDFLRLLHARPGEPVDLDAAPMFALLNPDKWSVTIDLRKPAGVELVLRLADWADVVAQNFAPGAMEKLGLGPAQLLARKPVADRRDERALRADGTAATLPGLRRPGLGDRRLQSPDRLARPRVDRPVRDDHGLAVAALRRAARSPPRCSNAAAAVAASTSTSSQIETGVYSLSEMVVRCSANGESVARAGNRDEGAAPHGVYPCAGDDAWIAIAVASDDEWQALVAAMGAPAWAREPRFATAAGRVAHQDDLDAQLAAWTRESGAYLLMALLQEAGVPAGVVQHLRELLQDPQLAHRRHFVPLDHAVLGVLPYERSGFRLSESPGGFDDSGPLLGEDNDLVLGEILGLSPAEIEQLIADEVIA